MKKLLLLLAMFVSVASFANPRAKIIDLSWDAPLRAKSVKFTDPYTVNYWALLQGSWYQPPYQLQLYAELNTNATVRWDVLLDVYGLWPSIGNPPYKTFVITIPAGNTFKMVNFPLNTSDTPDPNWVLYNSEGPH